VTWAIGEAWLFQWVSARCRSDSPEPTSLVEEGWTAQAVDARYGTVLMGRPEPSPVPAAKEPA